MGSRERPLEEREADFIKITETYLIQVNELDYAVRKKGDRNYYRYFGKLENALGYIREELLKEKYQKEADNLAKAIDIIQKERTEFEKFVKNSLQRIGFSDEKYLIR